MNFYLPGNATFIFLCLLAALSSLSSAFPYETSPSDKRDLVARLARPITEWTAMGDSYASGVGAGPQDSNNNRLGCFRFPLAYPPQMQSGDGSLQPNPLRFNNVACSGNTFQQILDKEFLDHEKKDGRYGIRPVWGSAPEFATITMGGNDLGILNLVLTCIYSIKVWGQDCDTIIENGFNTLKAPKFTDKAKEVIQKALDKSGGTRIGSKFRFFVTGYAQFFNQVRPQCNSVTFKRPWNKVVKAEYLTIKRRTKMNELALALNAKLKEVVATFPSERVIWIDYDAAFEGHRFCDRDEPNPNDPDTWFFNWDDRDDRGNEALLNLLPAYKYLNSSILAPSFSSDSDYIRALHEATADEVTALGYLSNHFRVFHPKPAGHSVIRAAVMEALVKAGIPDPDIPNYAAGWCGIHVTQYQRNEPDGPNKGNSEYLFDVTIKDAKGSPMTIRNCNGCGTTISIVAPNGVPQTIESELPYKLQLTAGPEDESAVLFHYNDQDWGSNDQAHHSDFGAYDNGKREGDTGFTC